MLFLSGFETILLLGAPDECWRVLYKKYWYLSMSKIVRDNYTRPISVKPIYHVHDVFRFNILVRNDYFI